MGDGPRVLNEAHPGADRDYRTGAGGRSLPYSAITGSRRSRFEGVDLVAVGANLDDPLATAGEECTSPPVLLVQSIAPVVAPVQRLLATWKVQRFGIPVFMALSLAGTMPFALASWWFIERHAGSCKYRTEGFPSDIGAAHC